MRRAFRLADLGRYEEAVKIIEKVDTVYERDRWTLVYLGKRRHHRPPGYIRQAQIWGWLRHTCTTLGLTVEAQYYAELDRALLKPS